MQRLWEVANHSTGEITVGPSLGQVLITALQNKESPSDRLTCRSMPNSPRFLQYAKDCGVA
jgi:hypothetical protein